MKSYMLDCSAVRIRDNRILCEGMKLIIERQDRIIEFLGSSQDLSQTLQSFLAIFSPDTIYFFLGVISGIAFISGLRVRL